MSSPHQPSLAAPGAPGADPLAIFLSWYDAAAAAGVAEPEAVALATATLDGKPSLRMVLYRGVSGDGVRFFTNYESRKGDELAANPQAAMLFFWTLPARRQVRIEGRVERLSAEESDAYFQARPRGHQISAWASRQSHAVASHDELVEKQAALAAKFDGQLVPRPEYWGGFRVVPTAFEFWTAAADRLHERIVYRRQGAGWVVERLAP